MSLNRFSLFAVPVILAACFAPAPHGNPPVPKLPATGAADRVWVTGSSNIRRFTCRASQVYISAEAAPEDFERTTDDGVPAVRKAALNVPVRSLDCGIGLQNTHLFETLGATANPAITFGLSNYFVERLDDVRRVRMQGSLRIGAVERKVVLYGMVARDSNGQWVLRGDRAIDMRDFGIAPPRRFLGLLRVRNDVTVHFEVVVRPLIDPLGVLAASLQ